MRRALIVLKENLKDSFGLNFEVYYDNRNLKKIICWTSIISGLILAILILVLSIVFGCDSYGIRKPLDDLSGYLNENIERVILEQRSNYDD